MPGIPLLNIGTALGGLAGGWNQAQSQGLQQAIQRLALQQQQGLTNQQTLASLAAQAGLLNQAMGGGQVPLQAATGAVPNQSSTPTPGGGVTAPPVSPSSGMPMPPGYSYTPPAPMSPYGPPGDNSIDSASEVQLNADAGQDQFGATNQAIAASGATPPSAQTASSGGSDTTPAPTPTPTPTPTPMPAQSSDTGSGSGGVMGQFGNGPPIDMSAVFQRLDYQKLAQGIAQLAPPGTSQADIYGAVVDLAKLADGDRVQQQQAGLLLRALTNGQFSLARTAMTTGTQRDIAAGKEETSKAIAAGHDTTRTALANQADATKRYIADQTAQIRRDTLTADTTAKWAQIAQKNQQLAQTLAAQGQREAAQAISQQLRSLQARIAAINAMGAGAGGKLTKNQQAELQQINDNIASIGAKVGAQQGAGP